MRSDSVGARSTAAGRGGDSRCDDNRAGAGGSRRSGGDRRADARARRSRTGSPPRFAARAFLGLRLWQWIALPIAPAHRPACWRRSRPCWCDACCARRSRAPRPPSTTMTCARVRGPLLLAFTIVFFAAGLPVLALAEPVHLFLRGLLKGLGVVALSWAALRLIDLFSYGLSRPLRARGPSARRGAGAARPARRQDLPLRDRGGGAAAERRPRRDRPHRRSGRGRHRGRAGGAEDDRERLRRHQP